MGASSSTPVLDGDGGNFSVKCRSEPLSVHDRAVLRVTKEELIVLRGVDADNVYSQSTGSKSNVLLTLAWSDIAAIQLAGRFLSVTQGDGAMRTMHLFKLRKATNVNSLVNLVRVHSEWRASRPWDTMSSPLARSTSGAARNTRHSWDQAAMEDDHAEVERDAAGFYVSAPPSSLASSSRRFSADAFAPEPPTRQSSRRFGAEELAPQPPSRQNSNSGRMQAPQSFTPPSRPPPVPPRKSASGMLDAPPSTGGWSTFDAPPFEPAPASWGSAPRSPTGEALQRSLSIRAQLAIEASAPSPWDGPATASPKSAQAWSVQAPHSQVPPSTSPSSWAEPPKPAPQQPLMLL